MVRASCGRSSSAAGSRSLCSRPASSCGVGLGERDEEAVRQAQGLAETETVVLGVHRRGGESRRRPGTTTHHHAPRSVTGFDELPAAGAVRRAAEQRERHVAAETAGDRQQVVVGGVRGPRAGRARPARRLRRRCRRPGRPATGIDLAISRCARQVDAVVRGQRPAGANGDVVVAQRDAGHVEVTGSAHRDRPAGRVGGRHVVVQADRLVDGRQRVVAVVPARARRRGAG